MAKDLPYFKFSVAEWLLGRIFNETDAIKGMFIDAVCFYWHKECSVSEQEMIKKLGRKRFSTLLHLDYFSVSDSGISIPFLDEQHDELCAVKGKRSEAGKKGRAAQLGQSPVFAQTNERAKTDNIDKIRGEEIRGDIDKKALPEQNSFFRIREIVYPGTVSEYFKKNHAMFFEQWIMKNKDPIVDRVFSTMNAKYFGYTFNAENHIVNAFTSTWDKIKKEKPSEPESIVKRRAVIPK